VTTFLYDVAFVTCFVGFSLVMVGFALWLTRDWKFEDPHAQYRRPGRY
jgi:hypothetical protein